MNRLRHVFAMLLFAMLITSFGFAGNADQAFETDPDSEEISIYGNVRISGTPSGHVTVSVDRSVPFRGIKADGVPEITFHFVPRKNKPDYQNIAFDLEGATVSFTNNKLTVISADRHIVLNLSLKKKAENKSIFSFDDSPEIVRIRGGIAFGRYKGDGASVEGLWLCGTDAGTCAQVSKEPDTDLEPASSFVVTSVEPKTSSDGTQTVTSWRTRQVKANGDWRLIMHGKTRDVVYGQTANGVYRKNPKNGESQFRSQSADETMRRAFHSHSYFKKHPNYARTEELAGLKVYVLRYKVDNPESTEEWSEESYSPKTGMTSLRTVIHFKDGSEFKLEAISVVFKDVAENLNNDLEKTPDK